jgi:predicted small secreted protein
MRNICISIAYGVVALLVLSGCGETVRGAWKDITRVGYGIKTVFVCDSAKYGE